MLKLVQLGKKVTEVPFTEGLTLGAVLADVETEGFEVRVEGELVDLDTVLEDDQMVTLVPTDIKGGSC